MFKVGEIWRDREGNEYRILGVNLETPSGYRDDESMKVEAVDSPHTLDKGEIFWYREDGTYEKGRNSQWDLIEKVEGIKNMAKNEELLQQVLDWYYKDSSVGGLAVLIEDIEEYINGKERTNS